MNKYQKALENLTVYEVCDKEIKTLQELVDKETPKKPEFNCDEDIYTCPYCGKKYETYYDGYQKNYCSECGQALDWSDKE